ncbi:MAG: AAA family ATPase [Oscillospiraceae bacterium]|nr:AAA family ATPase [Oscillospiraceae bacterium]
MAVSDAWAEAQIAVLGSVLIDPDPTVGIVMDALRSEDFTEERRTVFDAVRSLWLERKPIDPVTVAHAAGADYVPRIREWMDRTPTAANVAAYCAAVREEAQLSRLRIAAMGVATSETLTDARAALRNLEPAMIDRPELRPVTVSEMLADFLRRMEDKRPPQYLRWGIRKLDEELTAEPGDFIVLGADSSVGKTALAVQFAWTMAASGRRVGFFSLETSAKKLTDRIVAQRAMVDMQDIKRKKLSDHDIGEIVALGRGIDKIPLEICECSGTGVSDLRALTVARRYQVVFIDYLQLLDSGGKERWEAVTEISMHLQRMAHELGVAVIALSQLTTEKNNKARRAPTKDDLRESRQLKQDADLILLMSLSDPEDNESSRWLRADKNKDGPQVSVNLRFDPKHMDFTAQDSRAFDEWRRRKRPKFTELPDSELDAKDQEVLNGFDRARRPD